MDEIRLSRRAATAVSTALKSGRALLKFISANDVGLTGGHQYGFYIPKEAGALFTPHAPLPERLDKHRVTVSWFDGPTTASVITWYGQRTRSEYRLTRFGRDFPFRTFDNLGDLLVLVPESATRIAAFVLHSDEDIEAVQAALGAEIQGTWALHGGPTEPVDRCLERHFDEWLAGRMEFPTTDVISTCTQQALLECQPGFLDHGPDGCLMALLDADFNLFKKLEDRICLPHVQGGFNDVEQFVATALAVMNRRKARAGRSFENQIEFMLRHRNVRFEMRPDIAGRPDILLPGKQAYGDKSYPTERLIAVGIKRTCKDRWRQVLQEAQRAEQRFLVTVQPGITANQLNEIRDAGIQLVVPKPLLPEYPSACRQDILTFDRFLSHLAAEHPLT